MGRVLRAAAVIVLVVVGAPGPVAAQEDPEVEVVDFRPAWWHFPDPPVTDPYTGETFDSPSVAGMCMAFNDVPVGTLVRFNLGTSDGPPTVGHGFVDETGRVLVYVPISSYGPYEIVPSSLFFPPPDPSFFAATGGDGDEGTLLARQDEEFRHLELNPADVGGSFEVTGDQAPCNPAEDLKPGRVVAAAAFMEQGGAPEPSTSTSAEADETTTSAGGGDDEDGDDGGGGFPLWLLALLVALVGAGAALALRARRGAGDAAAVAGWAQAVEREEGAQRQLLGELESLVNELGAAREETASALSQAGEAYEALLDLGLRDALPGLGGDLRLSMAGVALSAVRRRRRDDDTPEQGDDADQPVASLVRRALRDPLDTLERADDVRDRVSAIADAAASGPLAALAVDDLWESLGDLGATRLGDRLDAGLTGRLAAERPEEAEKIKRAVAGAAAGVSRLSAALDLALLARDAASSPDASMAELQASLADLERSAGPAEADELARRREHIRRKLAQAGGVYDALRAAAPHVQELSQALGEGQAAVAAPGGPSPVGDTAASLLGWADVFLGGLAAIVRRVGTHDDR